ncbi:MAG: protease pro-enzyme activation domain-containing protein [Thermoplasmata archaeon]
MRRWKELISILIVAVFLASVFLSMMHGNDNVHIENTFDAKLIKSGIMSGKPNPNTLLDISIALKLRNVNQLNNYLEQVENPSSPMFHKFITKAEFQELYSPTNSEFLYVMNYFKEQGLQVIPGPYNLAIFINNVPIYKVEQVFNVQFGLFISNSPLYEKEYFAPLGPVSLPFSVAQYISGISGLTNAYKFLDDISSHHIIKNFVINGVQDLTGGDLQKAYQTYDIFNGSSDGASSSTHYFPIGYTVATILWEGTDSAGNQVAPFNPSDIDKYFQTVVPQWEQKIVGSTPNVTGDPVDGAVPPGPSAANDSTQTNYENTLDLEMVSTLAPGANVVCVYGPGGSNGPAETNFPDNEYAAASQLNNLVAVSNSWGGSDTQTDNTTQNYITEMEATGTTVMASAGDDGDTSTQSNPANDATNTVGFLAVGGTTLTLNGQAGSYNGAGVPAINAIKNQIVWYDNGNTSSNGDHWGTTSGTSSAYPEPSWQDIPAVTNNGGSTSGRNIADVAAIGNNTYIIINGAWQWIAGTSVASPVTAGIIAAMAGYLNQKFGFIDPLLYKMGPNESKYSLKPFWDVTQTPPGYHSGQTQYDAQVGWDYASGWGSINAWNFTQDIKGTSTAPATYTVTFTENGLPSGTSWSVTFNGNTKSSTTTTISYTGIANGSYSFTVGNVSGYTASPSSGTITVNGGNVNQTITFTPNNSTNSTANSTTNSTANSTANSTYTVTFTESGLPSGTSWSVTFNGNTTSSTNTTISFTGIADGSYSYTVGSISGYTASPSSGTITVNGANVNQAITFTPFSSTTTVKVYSYVNSSSISTYSLPEAEAFTVGSSTVNVNFVTLYLSGSGSIKFSIGTSLWKADVLANTTMSVSSSKLWYNTTISTISLTGGKTYYLNVYQASGSVQWGYTSSPSSSSKNYVQDYWYYGGTLYNDNSYPNIYTIGYKPTTSITGHDQNYNVPKIVLPLNIKNNAKNVPELFDLSLVLATPATRNIF